MGRLRDEGGHMRHALDFVLIAVCMVLIVSAVRGAGAFTDPTRRTLVIAASGFVGVRRVLSVIDRWGS